MPSKYDKDVRARAVRLVREHFGDYPTGGLRSLRCRPGWG